MNNTTSTVYYADVSYKYQNYSTSGYMPFMNKNNRIYENENGNLLNWNIDFFYHLAPIPFNKRKFDI
jgi:hypothetical protein